MNGWRSQLPCVAASIAADALLPGQPPTSAEPSATAVRSSSVAPAPSTRTVTVGAASAGVCS